MKLVVSHYTDEYKKQVMNLICREYNYELKTYTEFFHKFYEHQFQHNAIKIIVIDEDAHNLVVGFFALFHWPYQLNSKKYNAYKGVNAIVMPEYRGCGIFKKILKFVDENLNTTPQIDFLIATPLPAAFIGFKKNNWKHLLDLHWYIKPNSLFSFLFPINDFKLKSIFNEKKLNNITLIKNQIHQDDSETFNDWRAYYYKTKKYYLSYKDGNDIVQFGVKINIRKKIIRELIIGEVATNNYETQFLMKGLNHLCKEVKKIHAISFLSIAANPHNDIIIEAIKLNNFNKIKKVIHIVVKDLTNNTQLLNQKKWVLYRADLDSW
ncbi:MAG: GNAT family N-acetyltransferase [Flavobacteriales bacterium]|nr:GNAT family N-acetyltransferase [Flavobacteriales bacterium]MCB9365442.1 GNAT family N-acetyltransferase [Flavobacteriales bacterium]